MRSQRNAEARTEQGAGVGAGVAILNPLVREITQALLELGGAAHRDAVITQVAKTRGVFRPSASMAQELEAAFSTYCAGACDRGAPSLLHLPYGPFSRRWALTNQAYELLASELDSSV